MFIYLRNITIQIPKRTQNNGTLPAYLLLTHRKNLKSGDSFQFSTNSYSYTKRIPLSNYRLNKTKIYVNLLEGATNSDKSINDMNNQVKNQEDDKPLTHLLTRLRVYTMDSLINLDRNKIPAELIPDLTYITLQLIVSKYNLTQIDLILG